jgi:hypothetical protein
MPDALDELVTITVGGQTQQTVALGFFALSVYIENYTNQYVSVPDVRAFIPPYTARLLALNGTALAQISFGAPPGAVQVASITGQICNSTWSAKAFPVTGGPIGPIGVTSNYYDRNPLSFTLGFIGQSIGPNNIIRATYTVPASRKAFIETATLTEVFETVGDLALGFAQAIVQVTPSGGVAATVLFCHAEGFCPVRTHAQNSVGSSIELQPGDRLDLLTINAYTATLLAFVMSVKGTEFDA